MEQGIKFMVEKNKIKNREKRNDEEKMETLESH